MGRWELWAKRLMFIGTFTAPFYIIFPTNAGLYELFIILSATCLVLSKKRWIFPDHIILFSLILVLIGYILSTWNAISIQENVIFSVQFGFIILLQFPVVLTLTDTDEDFYNHIYMMFISLTVLNCLFIYDLLNGGTTLSDETTLIYTNYNVLSVFLLMMIIPGIFLLYHSKFGGSPMKKYALYSIIFIGIILMFSTQSRRIFPSIAALIVIMLGTSFFSILEKSQIIKRIAISLPLIPMFLIILISGLLPISIFARMRQTLTGDSSGSGLERRITLIEAGIDVMRDIFPLGTGYNNYGYYAELPKPHNLFIEPLVEGGLLAGVGVFVFFTVLMIRCFRRLFISKDIDPVVASFSLATLGLIIAQMFGTLLIYRFFWLIPILTYTSCQYNR